MCVCVLFPLWHARRDEGTCPVPWVNSASFGYVAPGK